MIDKFDKAQKKVFDTYYNNLHTGIKKLQDLAKHTNGVLAFNSGDAIDTAYGTFRNMRNGGVFNQNLQRWIPRRGQQGNDNLYMYQLIMEQLRDVFETGIDARHSAALYLFVVFVMIMMDKDPRFSFFMGQSG